ncbi:MAG: tyrosine-type recombinase/integrase [Verrucomicrobia bacterium]|jgi:integrase/recombinase XerD|nr:tyrosine-type recombinase/integrase [Verrucomicrobiota bacterium]MBT7702473.1 tyrosine-type recombinase/integrase [Verrucomicrobiota bacterium]
MTGLQLITEHLRYLRDIRNYVQLTITRHERVAKLWMTFLAEEIGIALEQACTEDFLSWIDYRRAQGVVRDASINAELCVLRTLYDYLKCFNHIAINPAAAIPALVCAPPAEQDYLTVDECFRLLDTCDQTDLKGLRNYTILTLFWSTGLRKRELYNLNCGDVNLDEGYLRVLNGKGGKARQVFLNDRIVQDLRVYGERWGWRLEAPLFRSVKPDSTCADPNKRLGTGRIEEMVRKAGKAAGIKKMVCPLAMRHSFATHMYEAGVSIDDLKEIMGHSNDTETLIYVHVTLDAVRNFLNEHIANHPAHRRSS